MMSSMIKELTATVKQLTIANVLVLAALGLVIVPSWILYFVFTTGRIDAFLPSKVSNYSNCQVYTVYIRGANRNIITHVYGSDGTAEYSLAVNRTDREFTVPEIYAYCTNLNEKSREILKHPAASFSK